MQNLNVVNITTEKLSELLKQELSKQLLKLQRELKEKKVDKLLTRKETTDYLSISISTLSKWTADRVLSPYGIGGRIYFKLSDIEKTLIKL